uniref:Uncharacterized protein n=1 Tax=Caenorhabditis japonica TaxID=281687 RepID=A0A8R1DJX0_CAEJA
MYRLSHCENGFLYPPPPKHTDFIVAVVVEKKGDETKTSMRQSEIYAYSHEIIIRDGYMVMPKISWNDFEPGDWLMCKRVFSTDKNGNLKEERELTNLHKVDKSAHKSYEIPATRFFHGNVQIVREFVLCPDFIRNREIRNSFGTYRKLLLMNLGSGFVHSRNDRLYRKLLRNHVHIGIFEFRGKDNGGVNFAHRSEIRDKTQHVLERDALWELIELTRQPAVRIVDHEKMRTDLEDLHEYAQKYDEELFQNGYYGKNMKPLKKAKNITLTPPPALCRSNFHQTKESGNARADQLSSELEKLSFNRTSFVNIQRRVSPTRQFANEVLHGRGDTGDLLMPEDVAPHVSQEFFPNPVQPAFNEPLSVLRNRGDLEDRRARVIMRSSFRNERHELVQKWIDRETGEISIDRDILDFKFNVRHGAATSRNWEAPLASSTPRTSPEQVRRRLLPPELPNVRADNFDQDATFSDSIDLLLRMDNNANPVGRPALDT